MIKANRNNQITTRNRINRRTKQNKNTYFLKPQNGLYENYFHTACAKYVLNSKFKINKGLFNVYVKS